MERYHHLPATADKMPSSLKVLEYSILRRLLLITMHKETFLTSQHEQNDTNNSSSQHREQMKEPGRLDIAKGSLVGYAS